MQTEATRPLDGHLDLETLKPRRREPRSTVEAFVQLFGGDNAEKAEMETGLNAIISDESQQDNLPQLVNGPLTPMRFLHWILAEGRWRHPWMRSFFSAEWCTKASLRFPLEIERRGAMTHFMQLIWMQDVALQSARPLVNRAQCEEYATWFTIHGLRELRFFDLGADTQKRFLMQPDYEVGRRFKLVITRFQGDMWRDRRELWKAFDIFTESGVLGFFQWYLAHAMEEYRCYDALSQEQISGLLSPSSAFEPTWHDDIPLYLMLLWRSREDVQHAFHLDTEASRAAARDWFKGYGRQEFKCYLWHKIRNRPSWAAFRADLKSASFHHY